MTNSSSRVPPTNFGTSVSFDEDLEDDSNGNKHNNDSKRSSKGPGINPLAKSSPARQQQGHHDHNNPNNNSNGVASASFSINNSNDGSSLIRNRRRWRSEPFGGSTTATSNKSVRHVIKFSNTTFNVDKELPPDMRRVYGHLKEKVDEEYALLFVFTMRTAMELHRAWHMSLLTNKILHQIKEKFDMRMTWDLGVLTLVFRVEDGGYELHRKVPYDYDSEFQDLYMKIAIALIQGHINIHEALIFQSETKRGEHTAPSGLFLRDPPGRLLLYPLQAATCAVIFFGGDWIDSGVAAICGLVAGITEWALSSIGKEGSQTRGEAKILIDIFVGLSTGLITSVFYLTINDEICMQSVFLGTLYWFFYGTAFVVGILEIIAGELVTGVTRFIAVSVKTFVLCLGASFGMLFVLEKTQDAWKEQEKHCESIQLGQMWWRIPLYLLCSASALGQYRFPIANYWRGLVVQLVAYEVQYVSSRFFALRFNKDTGETQSNLDSAVSNVLGAMAAVMTAYLLRNLIDRLRNHYFARILQRHIGKNTWCGDFWFNVVALVVRIENCIGIGRKTELVSLDLQHKLKEYKAELLDPNHPRQEIKLSSNEEKAFVQTIVSAEGINMWALLMPAIYQLVPGAAIAKFWFNFIFPPPLIEEEGTTEVFGQNVTFTYERVDENKQNTFANLFVVSTSLALGIILGFALYRVLEYLLCSCCIGTLFGNDSDYQELRRRERDLEGGMYTVPSNREDDYPKVSIHPNNAEGDDNNNEDGGGALLVEMDLAEEGSTIRDNGDGAQTSGRSC